MIRLAACLALVVAPAPAQERSSPPDSASIVAELRRAETAFFRRWRDAWMDSVDKLIPRAEPALRDVVEQVRSLRSVAWCDPSWLAEFPTTVIQSRSNGASHCQHFTHGPPRPGDRWVPDVSPIAAGILDASLRPARDSLVAQLDAAAARFPGDWWVTGQRVRFRLNTRDVVGALNVARACTASRWWCAALAGYAFRTAGNLVAADSAFAVATAATTGVARCEWTSATLLLDAAARATVAALPCAAQDSIASRVLWLGNPLLSAPANLRRVEHYSRKVLVYLHSAVPQDELYNWAPTYGGDALAELIIRYGWPDRIGWAGPENDARAADAIRARGGAALQGTPYMTAQYAVTKQYMTPHWNVIQNPFRAGVQEFAFVNSGRHPWREEHVLPERPIVQIGNDQHVLLRRDSTLLLGYATNLSALDLGRHMGERLRVHVVRTTAPDTVQHVVVQDVDAAARFVALAPIASASAIIGVEIPNAGGARAARTRFGIVPAPPLAAFVPGERAISDPVLLQTSANDDALPNAPDSALSRMLGDTRVARARRMLGVYWETYGFAPADSVDVAIRIQRVTAQGAMERATIALNMRGDRNAAVSTSWREPSPGHGAHLTRGIVPIMSRAIALDISRLSPGHYWLDVGVAKAGDAPLVGRRLFEVY